jgi:DNA repair exonuclease SbcCD ATPase subunit
MNNKILASIAISIAVIIAAIAGIVITNNRATVARQNAKTAESQADKARAVARKAEAEQGKAEAAAKAAEENAKRAQEERKVREATLESEKVQLETEKVAEKRAKEERVKAEADAKAASEVRKAKEADVKAAVAGKAKAEAEAKKAEEERLKAELVARAAAEKAKAAADERAILEKKVLDFETWQRELADYEAELNEREKALHPDKTAAENLTWVGEREADEIGGQTNVVRRKKKVLAENDPRLPVESRKLAMAERLATAKLDGAVNVSSNEVVTILARLYEEAIRADRIVEANYYLQNIRVLYPGWVYRPTEKTVEGAEQKKEED